MCWGSKEVVVDPILVIVILSHIWSVDWMYNRICPLSLSFTIEGNHYLALRFS